MSRSINYEISLTARIQYFCMNRLIQPMAMGLAVLTIAASTVSTPANISSEGQSPTSEQRPLITSSLSGSMQLKTRLFPQRRLTEASMTNHNLTAAYFFTQRSDKKLLPEAHESTK